MSTNQPALKDISTRITKGTTPTTMGRPFVEKGINFVKAEALNGDTSLERSGFAFIDDETHKILQRSILEKNDVLVTIAGANTGKCGFVKESDLPANTNQAVGIVRINEENAEPRFVYYFFKQNKTFDYIQTLSAQAAQPNLNLTNLGNIRIDLPPRDVQARIAATLSAYDDQIENNLRRIQLLEQAARLLYKEWFVHLRFPGHEHVAITDGVPDGWSDGVVADFYSTGSGGTPSRKNPDFYTGEIPWVKTQELTGGFILTTDERITDEAVKRSSAKLFPRHTVLIAMYGATIGQTAILSVPSTTNQACCAVTPRAPGASFTHAYLFFCHYKKELFGLGRGAAQNNVSQQVIKSVKMVLPQKELLEYFCNSVEPLFDQIEILQEANIKLSKARDLLLPRLMNGEVAV